MIGITRAKGQKVKGEVGGDYNRDTHRAVTPSRWCAATTAHHAVYWIPAAGRSLLYNIRRGSKIKKEKVKDGEGTLKFCHGNTRVNQTG